jgi:hypothetical protein
METMFLICAIVGGTLLVCQFALGLLGVGHHELGGGDVHADVPHDVGHDQDAGHEHEDGHSSWLLGVLTFRAVVAALAFFGLAGMAAHTHGLDDVQSLGVGLAAGAGAFVLVGFVMRSMSHLRAEGTLHIERAVGQSGTVYLSIPGYKAGAGKVHVKFQNRLVEYQAITALGDLPTGALVVVVSVAGPGTVEVAAAPTTA